MSNPFFIEEGIRPLVEAINRLPYAATIYSCEGHFDRPPDEKYLPTAYVTFGISEPRSFMPLYRNLLEFSIVSCGPDSIRLTYDCLLGRYTLSAWAGKDVGDSQSALSKHEVVRALVERLAHIMSSHVDEQREADRSGASCDGRYPCNQAVPPCSLIIPQTDMFCPFGEDYGVSP